MQQDPSYGMLHMNVQRTMYNVQCTI